MANEIVMTKEGYDDLVKELNELKTTRRAEISEKIRVARGFGDLSENSEYDEAKNEQAIVEARILTLENQLKNVKIIEKSDTVKGTVSLGSFVTIRDVEFGDEMTYRIISSVESSNDMSTITDESPVGKALLGHKAGETVEVTIPSRSDRVPDHQGRINPFLFHDGKRAFCSRSFGRILRKCGTKCPYFFDCISSKKKL